jgi:thiol:disulfide interchange protein DsbD
MAVTASAKPGERAITVQVSYQACDDQVCLFPQKLELPVKLNVVAADASVQTIDADLFANSGAGLAASGGGGEKLKIPFFGWDFEIDPTGLIPPLLVAMVGGFLLNFTPCVLPLIPIKVMSLSQAASGSRHRSILLGWAMCAGIVAFWLVLAGLISTLSGFKATNQLFQYPAFTIGVGLIIAVMAIGMSGVFSVRLPQWVYLVNPKQETLGGSFLFGVMTAVLSTPCTAPFMGAAAAWAATRTPLVTISTFIAIGVGMALPYLLLAMFPALMHRMPRTGPASELIKQVMGLFMLAAAAFFIGTGLVGVLTRAPDPPSRSYWWFVASFIAAAGVWVIWGTFRVSKSPIRRAVFTLLGIVFIAAAGHVGFRFADRGPINWVYYTPERLAEAQKQKKIIVLEFTAEWCLNCKALEEAVLSRPDVFTRFNLPGVAPIKVDVTNYQAASAKLAEVGSKTIPLLIIYDREGKEVFRSDAYTPQQVVEAIDKAGGSNPVTDTKQASR